MTGPLSWPAWAAPPKDLQVDRSCQHCGAGPEFWKVEQPLGETPGVWDPNHAATGESGGAPALGGGVCMRCHRCGYQAVYRETLKGSADMPDPRITP